MDEHIHHFRVVFDHLTANNLYIKRSKCQFVQTSIEYLGHVISSQGVEPDKNKVKTMLQWPIPVNQKQVRGLLGYNRLLSQIW